MRETWELETAPATVTTMPRKRLHRWRRACFELCEARRCLSTVAFVPHTIECCARLGAHSVTAGDMDSDGDLDVFSASWQDNTIAWYENTDGQGQFGGRKVISARVHGANSIHAADLDGDGDLDVLSTSWSDNRIVWYENTDGQGNFGAQQVVTTEVARPTSVDTADLDGDGDLDVLSASQYDNTIAWYENTNGHGTFSHQQVISTKARGAAEVHAADLDGDGDPDVVSASYRDDKIAWYENTDGHGTFGRQQIITTDADGARSVSAADLDADGDVDLLTTAFAVGQLDWYENRLIGDSNDDGLFNSSDLVKVFQAGEYEDGDDGNSTFDEGDWNQDGDFNSDDLVFALEAGHYEVAAPPPANRIVAAVDWLFARDDDAKEGRAFVA